MIKWIYDELTSPTIAELNAAGKKGWEVYATDGTIYKLKKVRA